MVRRHVQPLLCLVLAAGFSCSAQAGDALRPPMPPTPTTVDPAKVKAKELERLRLIARLHADAPKLVDLHSGANPLDAPIFHRYDRP